MNSNTKTPNRWIAHVKSYQAENGCTYAEALKASKSSYKKTSTVKEEPIEDIEDIEIPVEDTPIKKKRAYTRKKKVPEVIETIEKASQTE